MRVARTSTLVVAAVAIPSTAAVSIAIPITLLISTALHISFATNAAQVAANVVATDVVVPNVAGDEPHYDHHTLS